MSVRDEINSLLEECRELELAGDIAAALRKALQAQEIALAWSDLPGQAMAIVRIGRVQFRLGQYEAARKNAQKAISLASSGADSISPVFAEALLILGNCAAETNSLVDAEAHYRQAVDICREGGYQHLRKRALHSLGTGVHMPRGQFDLALTAEEEALQITTALNELEWAVYPLTTLAWIHLISGNAALAQPFLDRLGQVVLPASLHQGYHHYLNAIAALDEGAWEGSLALLKQALSIAEAVGEPGLNIEVRLGMSSYYRAIDQPSGARAWADDACAYAERVGYRHAYGKALTERARSAWLCGDLDCARVDFLAAINVLSGLAANFHLAQARFLLAALLHASGPSGAAADVQEVLLLAGRAIIAGGYYFLLETERNLAFPLIAAYLASSNPDVATTCASLVEHLKRVHPQPLRVAAMGGLQVWRGRQRLKNRTFRRRAAELFALLLITGRKRSAAQGETRALTFEQVAEALWPGSDSTSVRIPFHHATSALRRALEPDLPEKFPSRYLEVDEGQVVLCLPPGSTNDVDTFENTCAGEDWETALSLYTDELLPEFLYTDWTLIPRQRLNQLCQRALLAAAYQRLAVGRYTDALVACQRLIALEPWQEQAVLLGMQACVRIGDKAGALHLFHNLQKTLLDELGVEPQEALQALYLSLKNS